MKINGKLITLMMKRFLIILIVIFFLGKRASCPTCRQTYDELDIQKIQIIQ